ncbi:alpha/beta hydrolase [Paenibacillus sp. NPDC057967]|uniref:poly(ethylene terephthalate) hydrolase family protein n=1 Tax=Paenibacillus sp. NPDC057967 TaxID=3346293 RepID=UPI0036D9000E
MLQLKKIVGNKWVRGTLGFLLVLIIAFAVLLYFLANSAPVSYAEGTVEAKYAAPGEYLVDTLEVKDAQGALLYKIYYQPNSQQAHPLIAWGNGTGALPANYDELFRHLASWGFVVIDTYSTTTGTGHEIANSIRYMLAHNGDSASPLYKRIDPDQIAVAGHSQGSTGVINAHTNHDVGVAIRTVVSIALPDLKWCDPEDIYDTSALKVPFFIMGGTRDFIVSPTSSNKLALENANPDIPVMMAMAKGAAHTAIEGDGGKHRGYLTAWMRYQLMDDREAMAAFAGDEAEILRNKDWKSAQSTGLEDRS